MDSLEKALRCVELARSRRAGDLVVMDLRQLVSFADFFVICTGRSDRQVQAIAEHIEVRLKSLEIRPSSLEGRAGGRWVLMDYGDVIVHVFQEAVRAFYDLEGLWSDAPLVPLPLDPEEGLRGKVHGTEGT
jgi:ribosome-associated protein